MDGCLDYDCMHDKTAPKRRNFCMTLLHGWIRAEGRRVLVCLEGRGGKGKPRVAFVLTADLKGNGEGVRVIGGVKRGMMTGVYGEVMLGSWPFAVMWRLIICLKFLSDAAYLRLPGY